MSDNAFFGDMNIPGSNGTLPVPRQLLHRNTTTVNQILGLPGLFSTFSARNLRNLRILALTASSLSIVSCGISVFCLLNIDRRRRMFRHDLVFFLVICDLVKALVLMIYPLVILVRNDVYSAPQFSNTLGWFTAYCVEGADLAIFFFAIHFALLIFKPSWKWRNKRSSNMEGGLYQFRAFIWPITALVPVLLASLAFINFEFINAQYLVDNTTVVLDNNNYHFHDFAKVGGYKPYSAWCYLPPFPLWYKLVLSWGPRYFLIIFIFVLYLSIYIFVRRQSTRIKSQIYDFKQKSDEDKEKAKIKTVLGMMLWRLKKYLLMPFLFLLENLKNFFFLSLDDSSDSSRGRSIASSVFSFKADDSISLNNAPPMHTNIRHDYFGQSHVKNFVNYDPRIFTYKQEGYRTPPCSSSIGLLLNIRGSKSASDLQKDKTSEQNIGAKRVSIGGQKFNHYSENDVSLLSKVDAKNIKNGNAGQNQENISFQTVFSPIQSTYTKNGKNTDTIGEEYHDLGHDPHDKGQNNFNDIQASFQRQTYADIKKRRMQIQKNLRSIFVYPFSYIAIWIFPLIVDATQYNYEIVHGPVVWLVYLATIAQPLNGFVDTVVFLYREKPWNYSWRDVHTKELTERFTLKGELDEKDVAQLYHSDWGKKGWYYCGRFRKRECWHHRPQRWKRAAWYIYRFLNGIIKNDYKYDDNCNDTTYWSRYYLLDRRCPHYSESKASPNERQLSFPSDSTTTSDCFNNGLSYVEVPRLWTFIHLFPMLKGIDLDELNRQLRLKSTNEDFTLSRRLNEPSSNEKSNQASGSDNIFKANYSLTNSGTAGNEQTGNRSGITNLATIHSNRKFDMDTDFSDVVMQDGHHQKLVKKNNTGSDTEDDDMDMLAFLKGSSSLA